MLRVKTSLAIVAAVSFAGCDSLRRADRPADAAIASPFPPASDADAWNRVPHVTPPLPLWARMTMDSLPLTTFLQLELDALHRTENPLGDELSARLRWTVADANRCVYAKESAESDLAAAGLVDEERRKLRDPELLDEPDRSAVLFARKLTLAQATITDEEVARLVDAFGPDDVVGIVHTVAYANFQDRLFLALGLAEEPGGAKPPLRTRASPDTEIPFPARASTRHDTPAREASGASSVAWSRHSFDELEALVDRQKLRTPRVPEPDAARLARFPRPDRGKIARTTWGRFSRGYQPLLTL